MLSSRNCYILSCLALCLHVVCVRTCVNAASFSCAPGRFRCTNHICIWNSMVCDGNNDCDDGLDENNITCKSRQLFNTRKSDCAQHLRWCYNMFRAFLSIWTLCMPCCKIIDLIYSLLCISTTILLEKWRI